MMKKTILCLAFFLACIGQAVAERISEQEAYNLAREFYVTERRSAKNVQAAISLQMAHASTAYYAFNRGQRDGFVLVAADDCFPREILGYADKGTFDAANLPPNMKWWLGEYDRALEAKKQAGNQNRKVRKDVKQKDAEAERPEIEPLLTCQWGQGEPYNALCPVYDGERCLSGCVATAMAQLMYYHKYPEVGDGYSESEHIYDYDAMTDTYDESSSQESRYAVARLMYDAGIASRMSYGLYESYAYFYDAACGFVNNFKYDRSTILLWRNYYEEDEWIDMMYASLASSYPIFYTGQLQGGGGHAFVCDGYRDGYFHINWGWDGYCDGYFLVDGMTPEGYDGFNFDQEAIFNLRPEGDDSEYTVLMYCRGDFTIDEADKTIYSYATFYGGFYNYSLLAQYLTLGLKVVGSDDSVAWVKSNNTANLDYTYGYKQILVDLSQFPTADGRYLVYPAYFDNATDTWYEMHTNISSRSRCLQATVAGENITFSAPEDTADGLGRPARANDPAAVSLYNLSGVRLPANTSALKPGIYVVKSATSAQRIIINKQ